MIFFMAPQLSIRNQFSSLFACAASNNQQLQFYYEYLDKHLLANNRQRIKELNKDADYNYGIFIWASFLLYIPRKNPQLDILVSNPKL